MRKQLRHSDDATDHWKLTKIVQYGTQLRFELQFTVYLFLICQSSNTEIKEHEQKIFVWQTNKQTNRQTFHIYNISS